MDRKETFRSKRLYLLDMDGTLYLDENVFPHCLDFLNAIRAMGGNYLFLTNNSSKSVSKYVEKMERLHLPAEKEDFFTSTDAASAYLHRTGPYQKIYALGTASFKEQLTAAGFPITDQLEEGVDGLLMGYDTELTYRKLEDACILLNKGVTYLATNPDWVCPTAYGSAPDCGSFAQMLEHATGRMPYFIGKPRPAIAELAMEKMGCSKEETVLIGDRLYTDIACGVNAGITTCLVLSGEATLKDLEESDVKPTFICQDIAEIYGYIKE